MPMSFTARRKLVWAVAAVLTAVAAFVLYHHDPMLTGWMPQCWWHSLTGTYCPSCGTLRAAHAALHGRIGEAMAYNPFLLVGLPVLGAVAWCECKSRYHLEQRVIAAYVILYFAWWLARNIIAW